MTVEIDLLDVALTCVAINFGYWMGWVQAKKKYLW